VYFFDVSIRNELNRISIITRVFKVKLPIVFGIQGSVLSQKEADFFRESQPFGFILFSRNLENPDQIMKLTNDLKNCLESEEIPILIDEEGGSVQRLPQPFWPKRPSALELGLNFIKHPEETKARTKENYLKIGKSLLALGISVNAAPVLDLQFPHTHEVIRDRSFHQNPNTVATLGRAAAEGLKEAGVLPIMKHIPGHGRATVDSHLELPIVEQSFEELRDQDFIPFKQNADLPWAMTGHVQYDAMDPSNPATLSPQVIQDLIRNEMNFQGLLISDCLFMEALPSDVPERVKKCLKSGCDLALHCHGDVLAMENAIRNIPSLSHETSERWESALNWLSS
jgi:beta-N-acetylhexosaminidase